MEDLGELEDGERQASVGDLESVHAAIAGDRRAFGRLYTGYGPMVRGIVLASIEHRP